jgi:streptogramin lyase
MRLIRPQRGQRNDVLIKVNWKISGPRGLGFLAATLAIPIAFAWCIWSYAADTVLLAGRVTSSAGGPLSGIPIRAHWEKSNVTVSVYTNAEGAYSFPEWSALVPGAYTVAIQLPDFMPLTRDVTLSSGKTTRLDLTLQSRQPTINDATASEIAMAMPGTEEQKFLLTQCTQCHSLQFALHTARTREGWLQVVRRMAGAGRASEDPPSTKAFDQKKYIEPMADYLASIRGPGSSADIPFKPRPRPSGEASARIVVTEYDVPRGGHSDLMITRGDRRFSWPHDVLIDPDGEYVWYTDHFTNVLGRLNRKTGEIREIPFTVTGRMGRDSADDPTRPGDGRAGSPGGGSHKIAFLPDGNIVFGISGGTVIFNPKTEEFKIWPSGSVMFGVDSAGNIWYVGRGLNRLNPKTGEVKSWPAPPNAGGYDVDVDSQGRFVYNGWRTAKIGIFDPKTERFDEYSLPTQGSGPRRGEFDAKNRYWTALYWAGWLASFDANTRQLREFPLLPDVKPFGAPFLAPYSASVDERHQLVWTTDLNSSRIFRFDMKTERATEFVMPAPYESRDIKVDRYAARPTVWIPAYRPPSKIVKLEVW